jgi:hypothetical protein
LLLVLLAIALSWPTAALSGDTPAGGHTLYLPSILSDYPWVSPYSVETSLSLTQTLSDRANELGVGWMRLHRLYWRDVQPTEGSEYDWSALRDFEDELRKLAAAGIQPIVIVHQSPGWATVRDTACSAVRPDKLSAFAAFLSAAVERYKAPEYNVHHWELGNEPDVDPSLVGRDQVYGCWGDASDPYYGGRHYGEMLKVVAPAIRSADPGAKILIGGLLLDRPDSLQPGPDKPSLFFKGILEAGAADYFDLVPYHVYSSFIDARRDHDTANYLSWAPWGGMVLGKARFLRQIMDEYGVDKPLLLNETALNCHNKYALCDPPPDAFFQAQADHLVRVFVRAQSTGVGGITWYTLNGPGWRQGGLLDEDGARRPAFIAYQSLIEQLSEARYDSPADYGLGIEAYRFRQAGHNVHVVWSKDTSVRTVRVLRSQLIRAIDRDGALLSPTLSGDYYVLTVSMEPIYLHIKR